MMKKSILLLAALATVSGVDAKLLKGHTSTAASVTKDNAKDPHTKATVKHLAAKGTGVVFYSESFNSGMPAGWTTAPIGSGAGTWKWYVDGHQSSSAFHIDAINTPTPAGGFMIFDSDSIGTANPGIPSGYLQSDVINCSGHASVALTFDEYYRAFNDSCFVDISTNNFASYTRYPVSPNNSLSTNSYTPTNPYNVFVNITPQAANNANVKIRFSYFGPTAGAYSWQIDNVKLMELDPNNVAVDGSFLYSEYTGVYSSSIANVPFNFRDTIAPVTKLTNMGANAQSNFNINAKIYKGATQVYTNDQTVTSLPAGGVDSIFQFGNYYPDATGAYTVVFTTSVTGNTNVQNLTDTLTFNVTDTIWTQNIGNITGSYLVHRAAADGEASSYVGTRFDAPAQSFDTATGISVAFSSTTTVGAKVAVQIYQLDSTQSSNGWHIRYTSLPKTLTAADISPATGNVVYSFFPMDLSQVYPIITQGTWAAVVVGNAVPSSSTVAVLISDANPATSYVGYFGQSDTSSNDGGFTFGLNTEATGLSEIPLVRMHFGKQQGNLSVANVANSLVGATYPNPATNTVNIPFNIGNSDADVNVSISNNLGQVLKTQVIKNAKAGSSKTASFSTSDLASGIYFYTVEMNGTRNTGRFVVTH